ncbi:MFS transporter [Virgibacillus salarius]
MRMVFLLTIGMFTLGFDAYVVAGLLPDIGATFKTSDSQTGQAVTVFTLCFALAAPVFATLLAGKPARRILVIALVIFSLGNALSALASNFPLLLLARAIAGIGAGLYSPLATAAAAALVPPQKRGRALGTVLGGMSLGTVIGVPLGLIMATEIGWHGTLWLITTLGIIAMIGIILWFPDIPASQPASLRQRFAMMTNGRVTATVGITFVAALASLGLYTYIAPILQDLQEIHQVTPYLWAWGIGGVIGSLSIGTLIDRIGRPSWIMGGILALLALAMFSLPLVLGIPFLALLPFMVWGAMGWASLAPQQHVLLQLQPEHGPAVVALNSSANYLGGSMGSALGGIVMVGGLTPSYLPIASGCLVLVAFLGQLIILIINKQRKK